MESGRGGANRDAAMISYTERDGQRVLLICRGGKFVEPLEKVWHLGSVQRWETDRQTDGL